MKAFFRSMSSNMSVVGELMGFLWARKLWWLVPMVLLLMIFAIFMIFTTVSGIAPFIYTLF